MVNAFGFLVGLRHSMDGRAPFQPAQVVGLKFYVGIAVHVQHRIVPIGIDPAGLLNQDIVQDGIGDALSVSIMVL